MDSAKETLYAITAFGLRKVPVGGVRIVRVVDNWDMETRDGHRVETRRERVHCGFFDSFIVEAAAEMEARGLAAHHKVEYVGYRADSL